MKKSARNILTNNIIIDSLKFIYKTRDIISNIIIKKRQYLDLKGTNPSRANELHSKLMNESDEDLRKGFMAESFYHSFQLKRLNNQKIWELFGSIMDVQLGKLFPMLFKDDPLDKVEEVRSEWMRLTREFTSSCLEITKFKPWGKVKNIIPIPEESKEKKNKKESEEAKKK